MPGPAPRPTVLSCARRLVASLVVLGLPVAAATAVPGAGAVTPTRSSGQEDASGAHVRSSSSSTVRFTSGRRYVVSARVGGRTVRGRGTLPRGLATAGVSVRAPRDVVGTGAAEVLLDYGSPTSDPSAHAYALFTHRGGRLRPVTSEGRHLVLVTWTEGGDDAGFRCGRGRLSVHWFHHGSATGERTTYRLAGTRLVRLSTRTLHRPVRSRPQSCG